MANTGPVEYMVVAFPGDEFGAEIFQALINLVNRGIVRVIDLAFVKKDAHSNTTTIELEDISAGASSRIRIPNNPSHGIAVKSAPCVIRSEGVEGEDGQQQIGRAACCRVIAGVGRRRSRIAHRRSASLRKIREACRCRENQERDDRDCSLR